VSQFEFGYDSVLLYPSSNRRKTKWASGPEVCAFQASAVPTRGEVAERFKAAVLKTAVPVRVP
jgi:hypothetical protein